MNKLFTIFTLMFLMVAGSWAAGTYWNAYPVTTNPGPNDTFLLANLTNNEQLSYSNLSSAFLSATNSFVASATGKGTNISLSTATNLDYFYGPQSQYLYFPGDNAFTLTDSANLTAADTVVGSGGTLTLGDQAGDTLTMSSGNLAIHLQSKRGGRGDTLTMSSGNLEFSGIFSSLNENSNPGQNNDSFGYDAGQQVGVGADNVAVGYNAFAYTSQSGSANTTLGSQALLLLNGGSSNIVIGYMAGTALNSSQNGNIEIGNGGQSADNYTIRLGTPGFHTSTYFAGTMYGNGSGLTNLNAANVTGVFSGNLQAASFSTPGGIGYTGNVMIQTNAVGPHGWTQMMSGGIITNMVQY